jgi:hypothetical protein
MYRDVLKRAHIRAISLRCAEVSQPDSFISPQLIYIKTVGLYTCMYVYISCLQTLPEDG